MLQSINNYTVSGITEIPFSMTVQAQSFSEAEDIAYDRMLGACKGAGEVYVDSVEINDDIEEFND
jgi:hypothetical protein